MPLPFRQRIFVILVALTAVPTVLAVVGWALAVRTVAPSAGARVALEEMAASARLMVDRMDTTHLSARERAAFREHLEQLSNSVTLARLGGEPEIVSAALHRSPRLIGSREPGAGSRESCCAAEYGSLLPAPRSLSVCRIVTRAPKP